MKTTALILLGASAQMLMSTNASAALSEAQRNTGLLGENIFTDLNGPQDRDGDWLKDDFEPRLADVWKPYFIYDEQENNGANTSQLSLQSWEPRVIFQVRPIGDTWGQEINVKIYYTILYRMDGGFRNSWICTNHHSGDTEQMIYHVRSYDGGTSWRLEAILGFEESGWIDAGDGALEWTAISGDFERPRLRVYKSAGKHHRYYSSGQCEISRSCDDDCSSGAERMANLHPWEYYTNVGEPSSHPEDWGLNQPFTNQLFHIGYPNERTWGPNWSRPSCGDIFTGGMNTGPDNTGAFEYSSQGETCVTPVSGMFSSEAFW